MTSVVRLVRTTDRPSRLTLGRTGEELASEHLRGQGLTVLSRNWRCREGELDVIATDGERLIVCEVKTRSGRRFGAPEEAVTGDKQARIRRLAGRWLATYRVAWCPVRFDVIAIDCPPGAEPRVRHIAGAF
ncbi:putative endonuclease [Saccharomonospora amisosensis]|uniref:UPF0102 protein FHU38_003926 n=1 Tax=Saccharomonospora amisosensis TaxID=1128677 RepID=A0A7X5UTH7_9PSEU|nr:YraN family protein [Saccharomonospora amisosensis]NIJ13582.1 putative endonuclease [Saccharomonospora amisosensis]